MPPDAPAKSAVMAETILPAAPVITKTLLLSRIMPGSPSVADCSLSPIVQRCAPVYPISTAPGSRRVSSMQQDRPISAALRFGSKSTALTRAFHAFPLVRLGKTHYRATERGIGSGFVVAMLAAKPRRCHDEGTRTSRCAHTKCAS